jgi:predicted nucleic acid-binding protein
MKLKIIKKLERRLKSKPLHHIDASVIIEPILEGKDSDACTKYLNRVSKIFRGSISIHGLGEIQAQAFYKVDDYRKSRELFEFIDTLVKWRGIRVIRSEYSSYNVALKLHRIDPRLKAPDTLNIAVAIKDKADIFVTLDTNLIESSPTIEKKFKIRIKHPRDFI